MDATEAARELPLLYKHDRYPPHLISDSAHQTFQLLILVHQTKRRQLFVAEVVQEGLGVLSMDLLLLPPSFLLILSVSPSRLAYSLLLTNLVNSS